MKPCSKCTQIKPLDAFYKHSSGKYGVRAICKICFKAEKQVYQSRNSDKNLSYVKKWRINNPDKVAEYGIDRYNKYNKQYYATRPHIVNAIGAQKRATKLQRTPKWLTLEQRKEIFDWYELAKELSWLSLEPLEVDHIIPLRGENVSGLHVPWNLQLLPESLNRSKSNKIGNK